MTRRGAMHPILASSVAVLASLAAAAVIALSVGLRAVGHVFAHLHPAWLLLATACELVSLPSYAVAYQSVVQDHGSYRLTARLSVRLVTAGFGAFAVLGGFSLDRRALRLLGADPHDAALSVLALGLFELSILASAACIAAAVLLLEGSHVMGSMLWPWVVGPPLVIVLTGLFAWWVRDGESRYAHILDDSLATIQRMLRSRSSVRAWLGVGLYFAAEIVVLELALRAFGLRIGPGRLIIAFASGFLLTRRTLPLGGAGCVEVLLTLSLYWVGEPLAGAFAAVMAYRVMDFLLIATLALVARGALSSTLRAAAALEEQMALGSSNVA